MDEIKDTLAGAEAAILFSYDQDWAFQIQPHHPDLSYINHVQKYYEAFYNANIPVDFVSTEDDLKGYKLLVAPLMFLSTPEMTKKLENYVADGGHLILTMRTEVKDWNNKAIPMTLPGDLTEVAVIKIEDYDCLRDIEQKVMWNAVGDEAYTEAVSKWCDIITLDGAKPLACYQEDFYRNTPAITENSYKNGTAYYVGTELAEGVMAKFISYASINAGCNEILDTPEGVEITRRRGQNKDYIFIMNHLNQTVELQTPGGWKPWVSSDKLDKGTIQLEPYGAALYTVSR